MRPVFWSAFSCSLLVLGAWADGELSDAGSDGMAGWDSAGSLVSLRPRAAL